METHAVKKSPLTTPGSEVPSVTYIEYRHTNMEALNIQRNSYLAWILQRRVLVSVLALLLRPLLVWGANRRTGSREELPT